VKETPMNVKNEYRGGYYGQCPVCDTYVMIDEKYCKECGQRLIFSRHSKKGDKC